MKNIFEKVFKLMETSFPKEEYREYESQKKLLNNPIYEIKTKVNENGDLIAFISFWKFKDFNFIEHFAVNPDTRGQGIGSKMINEFIKSQDKPIILEVEIPTDEISEKRIHFYEKNGFFLNKYEYFQKPLRKNSAPQQLYLMSYPKILGNKDFEKIKETIYQNVYSKI